MIDFPGSARGILVMDASALTKARGILHIEVLDVSPCEHRFMRRPNFQHARSRRYERDKSLTCSRRTCDSPLIPAVGAVVMRRFLVRQVFEIWVGGAIEVRIEFRRQLFKADCTLTAREEFRRSA